MRSESFAAFILTHGRAGRVDTYRTLRRCGYTGTIYLLVDDEDPQRDDYCQEYGDAVIVFDKREAARDTDDGDNFGKRDSVVFARNANWQIARDLGLDHFWQLDDDYSSFHYGLNDVDQYLPAGKEIKRLDDLIEAFLDFLEQSGASSVAFAQGGDFIGGETSIGVKEAQQGKFRRKAMNTFFLSTSRPFPWRGRMNDDVNTCVTHGATGHLFATVSRLRVHQHETQTNEGGLSAMYRDMGTYCKSFYTVMMAPSCVKVSDFGPTHRRIHHHVEWANAAPVILREEHRKARNDEP